MKAFSKTKEYKNLFALSQINRNDEGSLMVKAEAFRYMGDFAKALEILELINDSNLQSWKEEVLNSCKNENRFLFQLNSD